MIPMPLALTVLLSQAPAPLPVVEAKDLPAAPRGPLPPHVPDPGAERGALGQARANARRGAALPALQLPATTVRVKDKVPDLSGWKAYALDVAPGEKVKLHVVEGRKAWFRVLGVNAWGRLEPGLLQNRVPTGEPLATYANPSKERRTIYFIVDAGDISMVGDPFEFEVTRSLEGPEKAH